jgi:hypothetical protein
MRVWILVLLTLAAPAARAGISQIGPCGVIDRLQGFAIDELPVGFREIATVSRSGVQLTGLRKSMAGTTRSTEKIQIYPIQLEYPELLGLSKTPAKLILSSRGAKWTQQSLGSAQLLTMTTVNTGLRTTIVEWGPGIGIVIHNEMSESTDAYVREMVQNIRLLHPGVASW